MAGISSKAAGKLGNKKGYNGNEIQNREFNDESGLDVYDFNARTYDQQIGRFIQIDPETEEGHQNSWTPYHFSFNSPVLNSDPDGRDPIKGVIKLGRIAYSIYNASDKLAAIQNVKVDDIIRAFAPITIDEGSIKLERSKSKESPKKSEDNLNSSTEGSDSKKAPNPDGKKGGKPHQDKVDEVENTLKDNGYDKIEREVMVRTPAGSKTKRFIDLQGTNSKTGETISAQVGKQNKNGSPVSRERQAAEDIEGVTRRPVLFFPYN
jgi:RHS repeat-associated protein